MIGYIAYTDSAFGLDSHGGMADVVCDPVSYSNSVSIRAEYVIRSINIDHIVRMFPDPAPNSRSRIGGGYYIDLRTTLFFSESADCNFIDNNAAMGALVRGTASVPSARRFISAFWEVESMFSISTWFETVASAWNARAQLRATLRFLSEIAMVRPILRLSFIDARVFLTTPM